VPIKWGRYESRSFLKLINYTDLYLIFRTEQPIKQFYLEGTTVIPSSTTNLGNLREERLSYAPSLDGKVYGYGRSGLYSDRMGKVHGKGRSFLRLHLYLSDSQGRSNP
jgi:hypothetical protein